MAKYRLPSKEEAETLRFLTSRLDERQFRTLLVPENVSSEKPERTRLVSRRRFENLAGGRGKLTDQEAERLRVLRANSRQIQALSKRGDKEGRKPYQVNRAIRSWIEHGKLVGGSKSPDQLRAIRSLRFLGVDVDEGTFYVKGRA